MKRLKIKTLERKRKSILTDDLEHCYICHQRGIELHEVYFGKNRLNSIKYGCVVPLCTDHHRGVYGVHGKRGDELDKYLKKIMQEKFEEVYDIDFISVFRKNYK